jgi:endonuclease-3
LAFNREAASRARHGPVFTIKRESLQGKSRRTRVIAARLASVYPDVQCPLVHRNTFELLVAVILSAQCTDDAVNKVTPELFRRFPDPASLAHARTAEIENVIRSLGLFRAKARSLQRSAQQLLGEFNGQVPASMEDLTKLAGVGRKTANVVLGHAFGIPGVAVDTHCRRVANRLGLTRHQDPVKIEFDLRRLLPPQEWTAFSHRLIIHGRQVCFARRPACERCVLNAVCPSSRV